ncbi:hypothetical protein LZ554_000215 [Drepanopeziza brunnea f. sp. 'monogermtubi']|nr:hypothetical protein LZ554_000215 [Drepanopeziza brunnea f. sp. 'monogermtubi']
MPIHHISIPVRDVAASKAFYTAVLQSLTYGIYKDLGNAVGFAPRGGRADFWIHASPAAGHEKQDRNPNVVTHVAFAGKGEKDVEDFHAAALAVGAKCNGPPGFRPVYHEKYYGAFILDLDGNNIECVYYDM